MASITQSTRSSAMTWSLKARMPSVLSSVTVRVDDRAVEEHVVDEDHAVGAEPRDDLLVVVDVAGLVGVDEGEVELLALGQGGQRLGGRADLERDAVGDAGPLPVAAGGRGPLLADVAAEQVAVGRAARGRWPATSSR